MPNFAIMRCKKLSTMGSVASSLQHCYRERETANADAAKTPDNEHHAARSTDEAMGKLRELLPEKRRKDAVLAVEYVMTASPDWWKTASPEQQRQFFANSQAWLANKYGADRVITATVHRDETSPHLSAFVVPLTKDRRLSAKEFIGNKAQMQADQTTFAALQRDLGLVRGVEGSRARHTSIRAFYDALEAPTVGQHATISPDVIAPRTFKEGVLGKMGISTHTETPESVAERITGAVQRFYEPSVLTALGARQMHEKAKQYHDTAESLRTRLKPVLEALTPLNRENQAKVVAVIMAVGEKALEAQREQERQKHNKTRGIER